MSVPEPASDLFEQLAAIEHQRWSEWQQWVHKSGIRDFDTGTITLLSGNVQGWNRQIATPYADLSEEEKQSDREQVMRYWPLLVDFVAVWLDDIVKKNVGVDHDFAWSAQTIVRWWREEMTLVEEDPARE